jgi:tetratricopeptide (TPR) repeat protein
VAGAKAPEIRDPLVNLGERMLSFVRRPLLTNGKTIRGDVRLLIILLIGSAACNSTSTEQAHRYIAEGDRRAGVGQYAAASIEYRNAVRLAPASVEARQKLAEAAARDSQPALAANSLLRVAELKPDDGTAQLRAASIYLLSGRYEESRARAEAALRADESDAVAHFVLGEALAGLHQDAGSDAALRDAARLAPRLPQPHIALGRRFWASGNLAGAETELRTAVSLDPRDLSANRALALFLMATDRASQAESAWAVVAANPRGLPFALADYFVAMNRLDAAERALLALAGGDANRESARIRLAAVQASRRQPADAHRTLQLVLEKSPHSMPALLLEARLLQSERRLDEALRVTHRAVAANPTQLEPLLVEGDLFAARGDDTAADRAFERAAALAPSDPRPYLARARDRLTLGRAAESIALVERAQEIAPHDLPTRIALITTLTQAGLRQRAIDTTRAAIRDWPQGAALYVRLGLLQAADNRLDEARGTLSTAVRLDPGSMPALRALTDLDIRQGRTPAALTRIEQRLRQQPGSPELLLLAGLLLEAQHRTADAERTLERTLAADPADGTAANNLACLYLEDGRLDEALRWATVAHDRLHGGESSDTLGWVHTKRGEYLEALPLLQSASQARPAHPLYRYHLAVAYANTGSPAQARDELHHALASSMTFGDRDAATRLLAELDADALSTPR